MFKVGQMRRSFCLVFGFKTFLGKRECLALFLHELPLCTHTSYLSPALSTKHIISWEYTAAVEASHRVLKKDVVE